MKKLAYTCSTGSQVTVQQAAMVAACVLTAKRSTAAEGYTRSTTMHTCAKNKCAQLVMLVTTASSALYTVRAHESAHAADGTYNAMLAASVQTYVTESSQSICWSLV
jgi:hypothetical protein